VPDDNHVLLSILIVNGWFRQRTGNRRKRLFPEGLGSWDHQHGAIDVTLSEGRVQMEVEVRPTQFGEDVVVRLAGKRADERAAAAAQRLMCVV
jgi:hypothetical protein